VIKGNDRNPSTPAGITDALKSLNPWVDFVDFDHHGYVVVEAGPSELKATLRRIETIKRRSTKRLPDVTYTIPRGTTSLKGRRQGGGA
jgi:alkaline phosphatase D